MVLRPILRTIQRKILRPLIAAAQRVFITLDAAQEGHYLLENPVVETGDFSYTFEYSGTSLSAFAAFLADVSSGQITARVDGAFKLQCFFGTGGVSVVGTTSINDGKLYKLKITRLGQIGSVFVGGISEGSVDNVGVLGDQVVNVLAKRQAGDHVDGVMANTNLGNGNAWKLDRATGNTEQAANGNNLLTYVNIPTGAPDRELFTLNTVTDPDQWENADKSRIIQIA